MVVGKLFVALCASYVAGYVSRNLRLKELGDGWRGLYLMTLWVSVVTLVWASIMVLVSK